MERWCEGAIGTSLGKDPVSVLCPRFKFHGVLPAWISETDLSLLKYMECWELEALPLYTEAILMDLPTLVPYKWS